MSKRAIFLGSFNPPHKGHIDCIQSVIDSGLIEKLGIDKIHVIPCWQNPNKSKSIDFIHRYKMCLNIFGDFIYDNKLIIDNIEDKIKPKYTYELIEHFNSGEDEIINSNKEGFWWIITTETIKELMEQKWKNSKELLYDNNFIVVGKDEEEWNNLLSWYWNYKSIICTKFVKLNTIHNFHSTQLREKIKNNTSIEEETNKEIQEYIENNYLYKE